MIDIASEKLLTLAQDAASLPHRPNVCSIFRWAQRGVRGHRLEIVKIGGRTFTSTQALGRFSDRLTAPAGEPTPIRTPKARERAIDAAEKELSAAGI